MAQRPRSRRRRCGDWGWGPGRARCGAWGSRWDQAQERFEQRLTSVVLMSISRRLSPSVPTRIRRLSSPWG